MTLFLQVKAIRRTVGRIIDYGDQWPEIPRYHKIKLRAFNTYLKVRHGHNLPVRRYWKPLYRAMTQGTLENRVAAARLAEVWLAKPESFWMGLYKQPKETLRKRHHMLFAMRDLGAFSKVTRVTLGEVAKVFPAVSPHTRDELMNLGFVACLRGRGGGSWLTELGRKKAGKY